VVRYWDGERWTDERATPSEPGPPTRSKRAPVALLALAFGLGLFACARILTDSQITRQRGTVVSIASDPRKGLTICVGVPSRIQIVGEQSLDEVCFSGSLLGDEPSIVDADGIEGVSIMRAPAPGEPVVYGLG
jgi:hypothetical protein